VLDLEVFDFPFEFCFLLLRIPQFLLQRHKLVDSLSVSQLLLHVSNVLVVLVDLIGGVLDLDLLDFDLVTDVSLDRISFLIHLCNLLVIGLIQGVLQHHVQLLHFGHQFRVDILELFYFVVGFVFFGRDDRSTSAFEEMLLPCIVLILHVLLNRSLVLRLEVFQVLWRLLLPSLLTLLGLGLLWWLHLCFKLTK